MTSRSRAGLVVLALSVAAGCSVGYRDAHLSLFQLAPGDEVQTQTQTMTGIDLAPAGGGGPHIFLGYLRNQNTRVPGFDSGIPNVVVSTEVDAESGVAITERLEVSD